MSTSYRPPLAAEVQRALARWPNVPAAFGWLALDRRGRWSVPDGRITHPGTVAFLHSHYGADEAGRWFVQNGPQRAYVTLDLAPWVFSLDGSGALIAFNGKRIETPRTLVVTDSGELLHMTEIGLGNLRDKDLATFIEQLSTATAGPTPLEVLTSGLGAGLAYRGQPLALERLTTDALPARFGYTLNPQPDTAIASP